jgi:hypothetical protein
MGSKIKFIVPTYTYSRFFSFSYFSNDFYDGRKKKNEGDGALYIGRSTYTTVFFISNQ